jgi:hypothetical protein
VKGEGGRDREVQLSLDADLPRGMQKGGLRKNSHTIRQMGFFQGLQRKKILLKNTRPKAFEGVCYKLRLESGAVYHSYPIDPIGKLPRCLICIYLNYHIISDLLTQD